VVHDPADQPGYYRTDRNKPLQPMEHAAENLLETFVADLYRDHPDLPALEVAERRLLSGLPPGRIVELAARLDAKLIVIGSRGMTGLPHLMQGSVSERVVELAERPVVVVKAEGRQPADEKDRKKREKEKKRADKALNKRLKKNHQNSTAPRGSEPSRGDG
jgi:nucleotide-binding universal stress UspA family protein